MLKDLVKRSEFWTEHHRVPCQGDSIPRPFEAIPNWRSVVSGKDILEIGPGEGRQSVAMRPLARTYSVADISPRVLQLPQHAAGERHLIRNYATDDLGTKYDVICFWYVLHHVLRSEVDAFFDFVRRHLRRGGAVLFNSPHAVAEEYLADGEGNGCETTMWTADQVRWHARRHGFRVVSEEDRAANCLLFHMVADGGSPASRHEAPSTAAMRRTAAGLMREGTQLNLGGGAAWKHDGWTNLEYDLGYDLAISGLADFETGSADRLFCSHSLEHMPIEAARRLVSDAWRVLKPGGVLRLVLPDCEAFVRAWRGGRDSGRDSDFYAGNACLTPHFKGETDCLRHMGGNPASFDKPSRIGHYFFWDRYSLTWLLVCAGFEMIYESRFGESRDPAMREVATMDPASGMPLRGFDNPLTRPISVYIEAVR